MINGVVTLSFRLQDQVPYRIVNPISALASSLRFGGQVPKRNVRGFSICSRTNCGKSAFSFRFGNESSKTNSEKLGVVNDNWFWTGDDDGMAQKYTDPVS